MIQELLFRQPSAATFPDKGRLLVTLCLERTIEDASPYKHDYKPHQAVGERLAAPVCFSAGARGVPQNEQGGACAPLTSEIYQLLFLYSKNLSEYRCDKMRRAKQYDLHCKNRPFRMLIALIMFSQKEHACGDKYGGFKKSQKIQRKYKRAKNPRGKAHRTKPQKLTKSYMAHVYSPSQTCSIELYAACGKTTTKNNKFPLTAIRLKRNIQITEDVYEFILRNCGRSRRCARL